MYRIIAGKYRHRVLEQPDKNNTRPTSDKVREAVFSSIQFQLENTEILDLFSGSGAWSLEALSRGAKYVEAIDNNKQACSIIIHNAKTLAENNIKVWNLDALEYLNKTKNSFDFIFIDAPFINYDLVNKCLETIFLNKTLKATGTIIVETDKPENIVLPALANVYKTKQYGKINLLFIEYQNEEIN
ncbi:16S rRNA (guanine(966)-N(2))-methyltransferase RsmD [Mycoplasma corogypsi]|uniref:16S rRNA (guanine(966)-N(2))-methyltransferase RsmD n=1 Tax=Mycoplasma corogypsi TaxID=2106 RepID=UPI003873543B